MSDPRFDLCCCGFPRWRHPPTEEARKVIAYTTSAVHQPHHLFIEEVKGPDIVSVRRGAKGRFERITSGAAEEGR